MGIEEYISKYCSSVETRELKWRNKKLLVNINGDNVRVLGFCVSRKKVDDGVCHRFETIPLRFQKNCRAFLRGVNVYYIDNVIRFAGEPYRMYKKKRPGRSSRVYVRPVHY